MSFFSDELICHYPLPDGFDPTGHIFLTKDTPEQGLPQRYTLQADGTLVTDQGEVVPLHGLLTFWTDNWYASGPQGYATSDDQPAWRAEYTAFYDHGRLLKIEGQQSRDTTVRRPHLPRQAWEEAKRRRAEQRYTEEA